MSESKLMKIMDGRNIALIYIFSILNFILYRGIAINYGIISDSIPLSIVAVILIIIDLILLILPAIAAVVGIKQKTLRPFPAVLTVIALALILLYLIYMLTYDALDSLDNILRLPQMIFFLALTLSVLYGFAAFAIKGESRKLTAAKIFGVLHVLSGAGMTYFYYKIFNGLQSCTVGEPARPDVWYYSPETLLIGFGIWAVLGFIAGVLIFANKNNA